MLSILYVFGTKEQKASSHRAFHVNVMRPVGGGGNGNLKEKMIYSISHIIVNILICSSKATLGGNKAAWAQFYLTELYLNFSWMDVFAVRLESTAFSHIFHLGLIYLSHACVTFTVYFLLGVGGGGVLSYGLTSHPLSRTSARTRPLRRPRVAPYTFLPVRATNPLRLRFTLSPYLIPLNPQLPPWLLTEHDSLWIALVINNSPAVRSASPAAGHPRVPPPTGACVKPRGVFHL